MKKLFALLSVVVLCFSLTACGGGNDTTTTDNNEPQTNETSEQTEIASKEKTETVFENKTEEVSSETEQQTEETIIATLDAEYLTGIWVWIENRSAGLTSIRSFELCADGTGKILTSTNEKYQSATFSWDIEDEMVKWESVSAEGFGTYLLELFENDLTDITWSDVFAKETKE